MKKIDGVYQFSNSSDLRYVLCTRQLLQNDGEADLIKGRLHLYQNQPVFVFCANTELRWAVLVVLASGSSPKLKGVMI